MDTVAKVTIVIEDAGEVGGEPSVICDIDFNPNIDEKTSTTLAQEVALAFLEMMSQNTKSFDILEDTTGTQVTKPTGEVH